VMTDAIASVLLVTEESGRQHLLAEGIPSDRIHLVGNLMIDTLLCQAERSRHSNILNRLNINGKPFGLVTLHRPANVDEPGQLMEILEALSSIATEAPLYFPVHPRTRAKLESSGFSTPGMSLIDPLGYLDFLCLMSHSSVVLTDSGGIQEETTALGIPCLTLRNNTERPVTVDEGTNIVAGTSKSTILAAWEQMKSTPKLGRIPRYWDGHAAQRCLAVLRSYFCLGEELNSSEPVSSGSAISADSRRR